MKTLHSWMSSVATGRCKKGFFVGNAVQASLRHANFIHEHEHMYLQPFRKVNKVSHLRYSER